MNIVSYYKYFRQFNPVGIEDFRLPWTQFKKAIDDDIIPKNKFLISPEGEELTIDFLENEMPLSYKGFFVLMCLNDNIRTLAEDGRRSLDKKAFVKFLNYKNAPKKVLKTIH